MTLSIKPREPFLSACVREHIVTRLCAVMLVGLTQWVGPVMAEPVNMEDRLRSQLRSTTQQLQQLQSQQAQLNAAKATAEAERDAARKDIEQLRAKLDKASGLAQALQGEQESIKSAARQQVSAVHAQLGVARSAFDTLQKQGRAIETQRASLATTLAHREQALAQCEVKNKALYAAGKEILAAYETFSTGDLLKIRQPFAASARVKFEEHAQALGDTLYDGQYVPAAAEPAAQPTAP